MFLADLAIRYDSHLQVTVPSKQQRYGKYFFDVLRVVRPDVAKLLKGSADDPCHKEVLSADEHIRIERLWDGLV